jgi:dTDP-4-amino-4,6-dideoxygalactose transaminase
MTAAPWDPTYLDRNVIGTFMGRDALALAVSRLDLREDDAVLLPAYVCEEVVKPFARTCRIVLYDIRPELVVDPNVIDRMLAADRRIKVALFVNYFGFLQPHRQELKAICAARNVVLIEDCAHSLLTDGSGETGDLSIYSFRKILPLPDGGGLRINRAIGPMTSPSFYPSIFASALSAAIVLKSSLKLRTEALSRAGLTKTTGNAVGGRKVTARHAAGDKVQRLLPLSAVSRYAMKRMRFDEIVRRRRDDYQFWQDLGARTGRFTPVTPALSAGVCPLGLVAIMPERDALRAQSLEEGLYLRVHWRLPALVGSEHRHSHALSRLTVTLPLYPELNDRERDLLVRLLGAPSHAYAS